MKIPALSWPVEHDGYDEDLLFDIKTGTIVLLIRGRNAWNSTWVRHYLRDATMFTNVPSAKLGAESRRERGNVFYIIEAPAIFLIGHHSSVVLCDAHPDNPFGAFQGMTTTVQRSVSGDWIDGVFPGVSTRDAVDAFDHASGHWSGPDKNEHSLRTGVLPLGAEIPTRDGVMRSLTSRAVGGKHPLEWLSNQKGNRYSSAGAQAIANQWGALIRDIVAPTADAATISSKLQQHRNDELCAVPRSVHDKDRSDRRQDVVADWALAQERVTELEDVRQRAENEYGAAMAHLSAPADSSAGVRAQLDRLERARSEQTQVELELERAKLEEHARFSDYRALLVPETRFDPFEIDFGSWR